MTENVWISVKWGYIDFYTLTMCGSDMLACPVSAGPWWCSLWFCVAGGGNISEDASGTAQYGF